MFKVMKRWFSKRGSAPSTPVDVSKYDPHQLAICTRVEMEHTSDPLVARKIAVDHLNEKADYYTRLKKAGL
jgi:hypothetical protein